MSKIRARGLNKFFGPHPKKALELLSEGVSRDEVFERTGTLGAVVDADFEVEQGELFVVMGLSGSGKSTLVRMINRLHDPTGGTLEIDGEDISTLDARRLRDLRSHRISMVFQRFALFPHRSVLDNAAYGLETQKVKQQERYERAEKALETVGLTGWKHSPPSELSGGMQQRVGLARALATDADILLMDEPFSALDPLIRRDMQGLLLELQETLHKTVVFITHDLNEAMLLGDRIAMMKDGRIVQIGTGQEILSEPANDYVARFTADVDRSRVLTANSIMQEPKATLSPRDGPMSATHLMKEVERHELYVLGHDRKVVGWVRDRDLVAAARQGHRTLDTAIRDDYPHASVDTPISELFDLAAAHRLPIAVVDSQGTLLGVIPRPFLLAALGGGSGVPTDAPHIFPDEVTGETPLQPLPNGPGQPAPENRQEARDA